MPPVAEVYVVRLRLNSKVGDRSAMDSWLFIFNRIKEWVE